MINVKIDAELLANAKFGEQVEKVVNDIKAHVKTAIASLQPKQRLKSSAVLNLYNAGLLTKDYFMAEFEKICNRESPAAALGSRRYRRRDSRSSTPHDYRRPARTRNESCREGKRKGGSRSEQRTGRKR